MTLRVTRVGTQVAGSVTSGALRVTRIAAKVAGAVDTGNLRVTRSLAQVGGQIASSDNLKISEIRVQVGTTNSIDAPRYTSELGTNFSTMGLASMVLGIPAAPTGGGGAPSLDVTAGNTVSYTQTNAHNHYNVTGSNTVAFSQTNVRELVQGQTATDTLTFTQSGDRSGSIFGRTGTGSLTFTQTNSRAEEVAMSASNTIAFAHSHFVAGTVNLTADHTLTFVQTNAVAGPTLVGAEHTLVFVQGAAPGLLTRTAYNTVTFSQMGADAQEKILTASNNLVLIQGAAPGLLTRTAYGILEVDQTNSTINLHATAIALTATDTLTFTQTDVTQHLLASATVLTAANSWSLGDSAIFPIELDESQTLTFVQSASANAGKSGENTVAFTQTVIANHDRNIELSQTLNFSQGGYGVLYRNGIIVTQDGCDVTKTYSPFSASPTPPIRPIAPILERKTDVLFYSPAGPIAGATDSLTLRTPNFGDRDRNSYSRINRESRGGSLTVFRDPKWPAIRSLVMDFSGIKDSEVDTVIAFLEDTLGQEIAFRDWSGRVWTGLIVNPDSAITRTGVNRNDIALEMEVTDTALNLNAGNTIDFTQSSVMELV